MMIDRSKNGSSTSSSSKKSNSRRRYATRAFEDDDSLHPMGLFVKDKGAPLDLSEFEAAVYKLLADCGEAEVAMQAERTSNQLKLLVLHDTRPKPTKKSLSGPPAVAFKLIGQKVTTRNVFLALRLIV